MTTDILLAQPQPAIGRFVTEFFRREPRYAGAALCLATLALPTAFAMALDQRTLLDISVWVKPLKFEIALLVYLATLAWFAGWLPKEVVAARWYRIFSLAVVLSVAAELVWIGGAAAFGIASHFNGDSLFMSAIYRLMGALAVLLTSSALVYGVQILRDRNSRLEPAFRSSVGVGLIATFTLTLAVAGFMASGDSHFVGGNQSDAESLPLMGWARDGGDLRVAHFFATHAMHFIPIFGFIAGSLLQARRATFAVLGFSAFYAAFTSLTFIEGLSGQPFMTLLF